MDVAEETPAHAVHMSTGDIGPRNSIIPPGDEYPADYPGSAGSRSESQTHVDRRPRARVAVFESSLPGEIPAPVHPYNAQFRGSSVRLRVSG